MIFAAFVIVGTVNAVNITDGLDGLSSSVTLPVALFFAVMGAVWGGFTQLGVFAGAMFGGLLGFLYYNHYPAKVFMGDTGSLFLGGAIAALAFAYDMPLILLLGFVAYGLSIYCYVYAQRGLGAAKTSAYYAVAPFISVFLSLLIFREIPSLLFSAAFLMMAAGTWLVGREK